MYDIDQSRINRQLMKLDQCVNVIQTVKENGGEGNILSDNLIHRFALERALHLSMECITDIGNALIDGFIMRDPGSYSDIIDILEDEKVFPTALAKQIQEIIAYRKKLVYAYDDIQADELLGLLSVSLQSLPIVRKQVEGYVSKELSQWK